MRFVISLDVKRRQKPEYWTGVSLFLIVLTVTFFGAALQPLMPSSNIHPLPPSAIVQSGLIPIGFVLFGLFTFGLLAIVFVLMGPCYHMLICPRGLRWIFYPWQQAYTSPRRNLSGNKKLRLITEFKILINNQQMERT